MTLTDTFTPEDGPFFGEFGGRFLPEALIPALDELTKAWHAADDDPAFTRELERLHREYTGRPSLLTELTRVEENRRSDIDRHFYP